MKYNCYNCGKKYAKQYELMLHLDFHKGEPVVREHGCYCGASYDIRLGKCLECGHVHSTGWALVKAGA
jgi:DNA-directed RNA polymerase subunit N (RpoN/RPB10)